MKEVNILPSKVLTKQREREDKRTAAGIIISANVSKDPNVTATIIQTGSGAPQIGMPVKAGQTVLFSPHAFQKVRIDDEDYLIIDVRDVLAYWD